MLLALNVAGLPNAGADVGGFFGNPEPELMQRWYQAAVFYPFLRGHAHLETKRREPWLIGEDATDRIRVRTPHLCCTPDILVRSPGGLCTQFPWIFIAEPGSVQPKSSRSLHIWQENVAFQLHFAYLGVLCLPNRHFSVNSVGGAG